MLARFVPAVGLEGTKDFDNPGISRQFGRRLEFNSSRNRGDITRYALAMADVSSLARKMPPKLAKVPPFPAIAMRLLSLLSDESAGFSSIASCIATDPVLSDQLIDRANFRPPSNRPLMQFAVFLRLRLAQALCRKAREVCHIWRRRPERPPAGTIACHTKGKKPRGEQSSLRDVPVG